MPKSTLRFLRQPALPPNINPIILIEKYVVNFLLLTGAMLCAIWVKIEVAVSFGLSTADRTDPLVFAIFLAAVLSTFLLAWATFKLRMGESLISLASQFRLLMLAAILSSAVILVALPDLSRLQVVYFLVATALLGVMVIVLPGRLRASAYGQQPLKNNMQELIATRHLLLLWLRYRIEARYRQAVLGILWIVLLPVSTAAVIAFAFSQLMGRGLALGVPFASFLLSGIVLFSIFQSTVQRSQIAMVRSMTIIKQVYFPREIIVLLDAGEALVDFVFIFIAMMVINAVLYGNIPDLLYLLTIIPILIIVLLSLGLSFALSWITLAFRDMQPLVVVALQLLFYITVLFSPDRVEEEYAWLIALNPLSSVVAAFRDITLRHSVPSWGTLYFPVVMSLALLYLGYTYFKVNEDRLVDMA